MTRPAPQTETADLERFAAAASRFVATPASPRPLGVLRIGLAAVLLGQALAISLNLFDLYGSRGVVQWAVTDGIVGSTVPRLRWLVDFVAPMGISETAAIRGLFAVYVGSLTALLLGYRTRIAAIVAWITHLMMNTSATASIYGVDAFANIALFYCTWMPVAGAFSLDRAAGRVKGDASALARIGLRVLQLHLCIVYLSSGIEKSMGPDWWNGEAIWDSLMRKDLCPWDVTWMASVPFIPVVIGIGTLFLELGYAFLIWPKRTRKLTAWATISMHVGIGVFMGLVSFASLMSVLNFAAWLVPAEPVAEAAPDTATAAKPAADEPVAATVA